MSGAGLLASRAAAARARRLPGAIVLEARGVTVSLRRASRPRRGRPRGARRRDRSRWSVPTAPGSRRCSACSPATSTRSSGSVTIDGAPVGSWRPERARDPSRRAAAAHRAVVPLHRDAGRAHGSRAVGRHRPRRTATTRSSPQAMVETDVARSRRSRCSRTLSGGEQARVALARVLAQEARILLLDEPTASLDIRHQEQVLGIARDVAPTAATRSSSCMHDLDIAAAHADVVVVLADGRIRAAGSARRRAAPRSC